VVAVAALAGAAVILTMFTVRQVGRTNGLLPLRLLRDRNRGGALLANSVTT
jgi:hypothetical protein